MPPTRAWVDFLESPTPTPQGTSFLRSLAPGLPIAANGTTRELNGVNDDHLVGKRAGSRSILEKHRDPYPKAGIIAVPKESPKTQGSVLDYHFLRAPHHSFLIP